jgi:quinol monooxygenase YgiN
MAIRHVVTIQVAPGKAADFASAFTALQAIAQQEEGCEQYELFQSLDDPDRVVLLERWASQALLDKHMEAERTRPLTR